MGGGTAGWMAAMILGHKLIPRGVEISVLNPRRADHRRGRGVDPVAARLLRHAGHRGVRVDARVQRQCAARHHVRQVVHAARIRELLPSVRLDAGQPHPTHHAQRPGTCERPGPGSAPDKFFIAAYLAKNRMAPKPDRNFPFDIWYGYHFDAVLLGQYLHKKAEERGVKYVSCHVTQTNLKENGDIRSVATKERGEIEADFFVDCTGFAGLLIQKALDTPFVSFSRESLQRLGRRDAHAHRGFHQLRNRVHCHEARMGLGDPAHQPLRQWIRVQLAILLGRRCREGTARKAGHARFAHRGAASEDAHRSGR